MGREIRRVPPNWQHPKHMVRRWIVARQRYEEVEEYIPLYDESFIEALEEWNDGKDAWERGERPSYFDASAYPSDISYEDYVETSPDPDYYRPDWRPEEMTWYQVYETVSEGTPVTPPFETKEELIKYLAMKGDFWDQERGDGGWGFEAAQRFVESEWAPSMVIIGGVLKTPRDGI